MKALDRKLWRDLRLMWSQALTIALVVASGVAGFITSLSAVDSLALARDRFYAQGRFADLFATVKRAPDALTPVLRDEPGVADVQTTLEQYVRIELPDTSDPVIGQLIGLDARRPQRMNLVSLRRGRWPEPGLASDGAIPALVSAGFAQARSLRPGTRLKAQINGKPRTLAIEGIALSPEFVFAGLGGMPDLRGFGIFWIDHEALAAAYDMAGAFNRVAVKLAPGASEADVAARLAERLSAYGTREVIGRCAFPAASHSTARCIGTVCER